MNVRSYYFTDANSSGNQSITGFGFQPSVIFFYSIENPIDTTGTGLNGMFGWAVSSSQRACVHSQSLLGSNSVTSTISTDVCIYFNSGLYADFVSFDSDGFTINWTGNPLQNQDIRYLAWGGDVSNTKAGTINTNTVTGNQAITGVGFKPDIVFAMPSITTSLPTSSTTDIAMGLGMAISSSARGFSVIRETAASFSRVGQWQSTSAFIGAFDPSTGATTYKADFVSRDNDGFTVNWSTAPSVHYLIPYLAIKGGKYAVGSDTQKTSTGTRSVSGLAFAPKSVFFTTCAAIANASPDATQETLVMGAYAGGNGRIYLSGNDNKLSHQEYSTDSSTSLLTMAHGNAASSAEGVGSSLDSTGFTINWTTADATAREFLYWAVGDAGTTNLRTLTASGVLSMSVIKQPEKIISPALTTTTRMGNYFFNKFIAPVITIAQSVDKPLVQKTIGAISQVVANPMKLILRQPFSITVAITETFSEILRQSLRFKEINTSVLTSMTFDTPLIKKIIGISQSVVQTCNKSLAKIPFSISVSIATQSLKTTIKTFNYALITTGYIQKTVKLIKIPTIITYNFTQNNIFKYITYQSPISFTSNNLIIKSFSFILIIGFTCQKTILPIYNMIAMTVNSFIKLIQKIESPSVMAQATKTLLVKKIVNISQAISESFTLVELSQVFFQIFSITVIASEAVNKYIYKRFNPTVLISATEQKTIKKIISYGLSLGISCIKQTTKILSVSQGAQFNNQKLIYEYKSLSLIASNGLQKQVNKIFQGSSSSSVGLSRFINKYTQISTNVSLSLVKLIQKYLNEIVSIIEQLSINTKLYLRTFVATVSSTSSLRLLIKKYISPSSYVQNDTIKYITKRPIVISTIVSGAFTHAHALMFNIKVNTVETITQISIIITAISNILRISGFIFDPNMGKTRMQSIFRNKPGDSRLG